MSQIQLNDYYASLLENPSGVRSLADLIAFDDANPELEEPPRFEDQSEFVIFNSKLDLQLIQSYVGSSNHKQRQA